MKKVILSIIILTTFGVLYLLTGCSRRPISHTITYENKDGSLYDINSAHSLFHDLPLQACTGDTVDLKMDIVCDFGYHVYVDDQEIKISGFDGTYNLYTFTMPDKDVTVRLIPMTKQEIWGY